MKCTDQSKRILALGPYSAMKKYQIKFKTRGDFAGGYIISIGGMNPMPGATGGFKSIAGCLLAIRCLEHVGHDGKRWWRLYHRVTGVTGANRKSNREMAEAMGYDIKYNGNSNWTWTQKRKVAA